MLPAFPRNVLFPPERSETLSSEQLRLQIVEASLLIFLGASFLSSAAIWLFAQPVTVGQLLTGFLPFVIPNLVAIVLARRGRGRQAAILYTLWIALMHTANVLVVGGMRMYIVMSMINLMLLIGVAVGASAVLYVSSIPIVLFSVAHWLTRGTPLFDAELPQSPDLDFVANAATLVSTGFVIAACLRVFWAHVDHAAQSLEELRTTRDHLDERHRRAVELSQLAQLMLETHVKEDLRAEFLKALTNTEDVLKAELLDEACDDLRLARDFGVNRESLERLIHAHAEGDTQEPYPLSDAGPDLYAMTLGSRAQTHAHLVLKTRPGAPLKDTSMVFTVSAARSMVSSLLRLESEDRFRRTQRMETLGQFTGGIAHDFNNLLTTILGSTELALMALDDAPPDTDAVGGQLEVTRTGALQAGALVDRLLAFARRTKRDRRAFELCQYIQSEEPFLRTTLGDGCQMSFSYPDEPAWLYCDPVEVQQVLVNLVANARTAMGGAGDLSIELRHARAGHILMEVGDSGPGIPLEKRSQIFKRFFTTRSETGGLGLGLATVASIIDGVGGTVEVSKSHLGGAAFLVSWPLGAAHEMSQEAGLEQEIAAHGSTHCLVVDDDVLVRATVASMLEALGHAAVQADGVDEALRQLDENAALGVVITDYLMPDRTGGDLIVAMRERGDTRPVILVSGYEQASDARPDARMGKPFTLSELQTTLSQVMVAHTEGTGHPGADSTTA